MQPTKITERIKNKAFELLEQHPEGLRYSELHSKIQAADSGFNSNTINGCIWNLDAVFPEKVYTPGAEGRRSEESDTTTAPLNSDLSDLRPSATLNMRSMARLDPSTSATAPIAGARAGRRGR
jgi:hypothetical protein